MKKIPVIKIVRFIYNLISDLIVLAGVAVFILFCIGIRLNSVKTGSMEPAIKIGSLCFVNLKSDYESLQKGDIITYSMDGGLNVTHRIIEIKDEGLITQGDANNKEDAVVVTKDNYVGKVIFCVDYIGYFFIFLRQKKGLFISVICVIAFILSGYVIKDDSTVKSK